MLHGFIIYHCPLGSGNLSTVTFHRNNFFQFSYQTRYDISSRGVKKSVIFCTFTVLTIHVVRDIYNNKHILLSSLRHFMYNSCGQSIIWVCRKAVAENSIILRYLFFRIVNRYLTTFERLCCLQLQGHTVQFHPKYNIVTILRNFDNSEPVTRGNASGILILQILLEY